MNTDFNQKASEIVDSFRLPWDKEALAKDLETIALPLSGDLKERAKKAPAYSHLGALMRSLRGDKDLFNGVANAMVAAFQEYPDHRNMIRGDMDVLRNEIFPRF